MLLSKLSVQKVWLYLGVLRSPYPGSPYSTTVSISPVRDSQNREIQLKHTSQWEGHVPVPRTTSVLGMKWGKEILVQEVCIFTHNY